VRGMSFGTIEETSAKAWLSVMTRDGFLPISASVCCNSLSLTVIAFAPASKISRITCCWGRISLPLGAALSIGITRITKSSGLIRSATSLFSGSLPSARAAIFSFNKLMFSPVIALTGRISLEDAIPRKSAPQSSHLLRAVM